MFSRRSASSFYFSSFWQPHTFGGVTSVRSLSLSSRLMKTKRAVEAWNSNSCLRLSNRNSCFWSNRNSSNSNNRQVRSPTISTGNSTDSWTSRRRWSGELTRACACFVHFTHFFFAFLFLCPTIMFNLKPFHQKLFSYVSLKLGFWSLSISALYFCGTWRFDSADFLLKTRPAGQCFCDWPEFDVRWMLKSFLNLE